MHVASSPGPPLSFLHLQEIIPLVQTKKEGGAWGEASVHVHSQVCIRRIGTRCTCKMAVGHAHMYPARHTFIARA